VSRFFGCLTKKKESENLVVPIGFAERILFFQKINYFQFIRLDYLLEKNTRRSLQAAYKWK
jgi:hypothetical protein